MNERPVDWQQIADQRGRRNAQLERELRHVGAERRRLERLLSIALQIAAGPDCDPLAMLEVTAALAGDELPRPAFVLDEEGADENPHFHGQEPPPVGSAA